jgi:alkylation response protein AidB-like acyl-CoA dehydrogenase
MDLRFSPEDNAFREEVRTWLAANVPTDRRPKRGPEMREYDLAWQRKLYDAGWGNVAWPIEDRP